LQATPINIFFPTNSNFAPVENIGWDLSHARRFVNVFQTLYETKDYLGLNFPGDNILKMFANQFAYRVFNGDFEYPLFSNYFDGTNGWYRVDYDKRKNFGYGPSDMSITAYSGGFMFWKDYNPDIKIIANSLYALIHTSNQEKLDFLNQRYEKNYWTNRTTTNLPIRVQSIFFKNNILEVDNISTRFTLLSFYASLAIPNKKSSPLNSIPDPVNLYPNPAKDQAIVISEKKITEISVYDLSGTLLYRKKHNNSIVSISLNEFSSGTYIVVIKDENNSISRKKLTVL
jgi:predicted Zn-dependent protease with MMP-like domain